LKSAPEKKYHLSDHSHFRRTDFGADKTIRIRAGLSTEKARKKNQAASKGKEPPSCNRGAVFQEQAVA